MQSKIKLLVPLAVLALVVAALTLSLYEAAQTGSGPPVQRLRIWGYVTYSHEDCDFTSNDTVWLYDDDGLTKLMWTKVFQSGPFYKYQFPDFPMEEGYYKVHGSQGSCGCATDFYRIYWDFSDVRQDIDFDIAPIP